MEGIMPRTSSGNFHRELRVPGIAISALIGTNGTNIRSFRNSPGISSLTLSSESGKLDIHGESEEAVNGVAWALELRVCSIVNKAKGFNIDFLVFCFCKSLAQPLLSVNKICFEMVSEESIPSFKEDPISYLCFKSGETCEGSTFVRSVCDEIQYRYKSDLSGLSSRFANNVAVSENALYSYWDFSAYGNKLLSCLRSLRLQERETSTTGAHTVKLNIRFGKYLLYGPNLCDGSGNGDFISLSRLQELFRRRSFNYFFSTACSKTVIRDVRLQLERLEYVKVSTRKKIEIEVADLDELMQPPRFIVTLHCDGHEGLFYNGEIKRISRAKDYFQVLDVDRGASDHEVKRAYRRCLIRIQFNNGSESENATRLAEEAYVSLLDPARRDRYLQKGMGTSEPEPLTSSEERPVITRIRSRAKRHGFVTFCREGQTTMDFRLGVVSHEADFNNIPPEIVEWVEQAWRDRTPDQLLVFPGPGRFLVVYIGYTEIETYATEDWEFRISRVRDGNRIGVAQNEKWECALTSRWLESKNEVGVSTSMDSAVKTHVDALVKEASKFSEVTS